MAAIQPPFAPFPLLRNFPREPNVVWVTHRTLFDA
jgi:hypothetical protein